MDRAAIFPKSKRDFFGLFGKVPEQHLTRLPEPGADDRLFLFHIRRPLEFGEDRLPPCEQCREILGKSLA